jgi:hypothetical protein
VQELQRIRAQGAGGLKKIVLALYMIDKSLKIDPTVIPEPHQGNRKCF